ncbi:MAG: enoyl-CoA hydratase [Pirellulaceae bacterium]|nr:MAG: enoyl-CoA hydratase [Pirellulaceae bacterium]
MNAVKISTHPPSGTIILNRPDKRNALNRALLVELREALHQLMMEPSVRAVILTGAGTAFCAGMDLNEMYQTSQQEDALARWHEDAVLYRDLLLAMLEFPKPIIAAVNGAAVAGGAGLVLASDLVVAAEDAQFGLPEPRRGIVAGMVAPLLHFRAGGGHASYLLLSARIVSAQEAVRMGIFHDLVRSDLVWARAHQWAGELSQSAPEALRMTKEMLNQTIGEHLETLLTAGAAISAAARTTHAAREGLRAFIEKRPPNWDAEPPEAPPAQRFPVIRKEEPPPEQQDPSLEN